MESEMEWDSDSDVSDFYGPTGKELEDFLANTDDTSSIRTTIVSATSSITCQEDEDILNINNVLLLNKQTEAKYIKLEEVLYKSLLEIRQKIRENSQAIVSHTNTMYNNEFNNYLRCGKPYFKDKFNFSSPDNADTIIMKQAQMFDFCSVTSIPGWTVKDKTKLVNVLQEMSRDIKKKQLDAQISKLSKENDPKNLVEIAKLGKQISALKKMSLKETALPLDQEYDWELVATKLNQRHTAEEYQSLWKLFFHPSINKSNWSQCEHHKLKVIASKNNMQDWDLIAKQLATGRTGYQCFVYFRTNMIDQLSGRKWTSEEIEYLLRVTEYFREGTYIPWGKVATAMENRTKIQVYNKFTRLVESRKGRFLEEEDMVIINCYNKYGGDFKKMTEYLPGRSAIQIRTRYNILTKYRVSTTWSVEDDKKLLQLMANQDSNCFSSVTKHFPGKDRMHIRSRYKTLLKWMKSHPTSNISDAPRRGARRLIHGYGNMTLNEALTNLNKRMETEVTKRKRKRLTITSHEKDIEDGIMASLINEIIREDPSKGPRVGEVGEIVDMTESDDQWPTNIQNLHKILIFLKASLDVKKFKNSSYYTKYSCLTDENIKIGDGKKVKSYSKTRTIETIRMSDIPDIWGNVKIGELNYVLPPNFSTITGCRVLINNFNKLTEVKDKREKNQELNLSLMARRNEYFKKAWRKFKERFQSLFLWPLLLSNELPPAQKKAYTPTKDQEIEPPGAKKPKLTYHTGVTIPVPSQKYIKKTPKKDAKTLKDDINLSPHDVSETAHVNFSELLDNYAMLTGYHSGND